MPAAFRFQHLDDEAGPVTVVESPVGLALVHFGSLSARAVRDALDARFGPVEVTEGALASAGQLVEYLRGERQTFALALDFGAITPFQGRVWSTLARVPFGATVSYGELARHAGSPGGARAIGGAMGKNPLPLVVPCHRVIQSGGGLGGFGGGLPWKRRLLTLERITLPGDPPAGDVPPRRRLTRRLAG